MLAKNRMKFFVYAARATKRGGARSAQSSLPGEPRKTPRFRRFLKSLLAKRTPIKKRSPSHIMRKAQKKQTEDFLKLLSQAHDEIKNFLEKEDLPAALDLLEQCQQGALGLGNLIEKTEGEGFVTIPFLEEYCELTWQLYEELAKTQSLNAVKAHKRLRKALIQIENSVRRDIPVRYEIAFLPYKASMWDSMESIWQAAEADPDCDPYVVPIPYYDRGGNGLPAAYHYEGNELPSYVPVTQYQSYPLNERQPDVIYIHNPYDYANYVTTIAPEFYSSELKKHTNCLVYVPYYSTTGGMSDGQASCPAYYNADYIIIQAEKYRKFFDPALPSEKLAPLGSPKFDRVLRMCQNPPQPPASWKGKMAGKKVYFYNTSLNGMLGDTERFLRKMRYVFSCFEGRPDACLLWRPHPLLESTFLSMRASYKPEYDALREKFIRKDLGIYDDTPDITQTIALCDAYIGDAGTSVTSLFGMAGKPQFILDMAIDSEPEEGDWRGGIVRGFPVASGIKDGLPCIEKDAWMTTQGNKLYRSRGGDGVFRHVCDLSEYAYGSYYGGPAIIDGQVYMYPINAQEILQIGETGVERRIPLKAQVEQGGAFYGAVAIGRYLFLLPNRYPSLVRYDTKNDEIRYLDVDKDVFVGIAPNGERRCGPVGVKGVNLYLASPVSPQVLVVDSETGGWQRMTVQTDYEDGCVAMPSLPGDSDFWLLPYSGTTVIRWNPETEEVREYPIDLEGFSCRQIPFGYECRERAFASAAFYEDDVYLSPLWGSGYVRLNRTTGEAVRWDPPIELRTEAKNGYFASWAGAYLDCLLEGGEIREYRLFSVRDSKLYRSSLSGCSTPAPKTR